MHFIKEYTIKKTADQQYNIVLQTFIRRMHVCLTVIIKLKTLHFHSYKITNGLPEAVCLRSWFVVTWEYTNDDKKTKTLSNAEKTSTGDFCIIRKNYLERRRQDEDY